MRKQHATFVKRCSGGTIASLHSTPSAVITAATTTITNLINPDRVTIKRQRSADSRGIVALCMQLLEVEARVYAQSKQRPTLPGYTLTADMLGRF